MNMTAQLVELTVAVTRAIKELHRNREAVKRYEDDLGKIKAGMYPKSKIKMSREELQALAADSLERGKLILSGGEG